MILSIWKKSEKDRNCLIKIDDSVWGTMPEKVLRTLHYYQTGSRKVTESEADILLNELLRIAWNKLTEWLSRQEHSVQDSKDYLHKFNFHDSIIEKCITEALKKSYIDDKRYCELLIKSLIERKKSMMQIKSKLIEKHMPSSLWEPIIQTLDLADIEADNLREQAKKAYLRYRHLDKRECYEKCLTTLFRKGFDLDKSRDVLVRIVWKK